MTAFDLFAVGDNCIDKLSGHAEAVLVGGNAVNVAVQTARSGLSAAYAGALGPDGDRVADTLAANGVDIRWLVRRDAPTSVTEIYVGADGERTLLKEDFGACSGWTPDAAARAAIAQARHVHIGWLDDGGALRRALKASGISVSQDLSVNVTSEENIRADGLSIAFASLPEARASEAAGRAAALVADGADTAVITLGRAGSFALAGGREWRTGAEPIIALDTTGAGDSYIAGFLTARLNGAEMQEAMLAGHALAARTCSHPGGFPQ
ncbi:PfkB family carbohydrate kinase [Flavimaricola marinus]|uniref:Fructosamine kinase FrlD n=1 Tax=Flavimaricola marinus TaxID=1819565 RepID=A0A238LLK8_9RHOB|nr:PfkB family carbohydrate kinase [Flavimaricola marinus]SMY09836.1 Fructosamine kinase FrlD [Flavimaricola marinus]